MEEFHPGVCVLFLLFFDAAAAEFPMDLSGEYVPAAFAQALVEGTPVEPPRQTLSVSPFGVIEHWRLGHFVGLISEIDEANDGVRLRLRTPDGPRAALLTRAPTPRVSFGREEWVRLSDVLPGLLERLPPSQLAWMSMWSLGWYVADPAETALTVYPNTHTGFAPTSDGRALSGGFTYTDVGGHPPGRVVLDGVEYAIHVSEHELTLREEGRAYQRYSGRAISLSRMIQPPFLVVRDQLQLYAVRTLTEPLGTIPGESWVRLWAVSTNGDSALIQSGADIGWADVRGLRERRSPIHSATDAEPGEPIVLGDLPGLTSRDDPRPAPLRVFADAAAGVAHCEADRAASAVASGARKAWVRDVDLNRDEVRDALCLFETERGTVVCPMVRSRATTVAHACGTVADASTVEVADGALVIGGQPHPGSPEAGWFGPPPPAPEEVSPGAGCASAPVRGLAGWSLLLAVALYRRARHPST